MLLKSLEYYSNSQWLIHNMEKKNIEEVLDVLFNVLKEERILLFVKMMKYL